MNWIYLLITFIGFFLLRALYYYYKLVRTKELKKHYYQYLKDAKYSFLQHKPQIISLFKEAGVKNFSFTHVEEITYDKGLRHSLSGFDNIQTNRADVVGIVKARFEEAIGIFKHRMHQSYNPFYWVEFILKLPQIILSYINLSPPDSIMKIIQLIYWTIGFIVALDRFKIIDVLSWFK